MRWSVSVMAEGDRVLTHDEIIELADAVAALDGIASGIGSMAYGAQLLVHAGTSDEAAELAIAEFIQAASRAGLPSWPVTRVETLSEADELDDIG